jgi:hypothetical protein
MTVAAWLVAMMQPLISRILVVLGLSLVTYTGLDFVLNGLVTAVQTSWGALPATTLQLARLAGIAEGLSIIGSAIATKILLITLQQSQSLFVRTAG